MSTVDDALQALTDLTPGRQQILADVVAGLSRPSRQLPSKYFYDARGSRLFEQITQTREYYPTRTELALLARVLPDIARWPQDRAAAGRAAGPGGLHPDRDLARRTAVQHRPPCTGAARRGNAAGVCRLHPSRRPAHARARTGAPAAVLPRLHAGQLHR
ncbi:hypothetical protein G6F31_017772 [Rhizopus arrhizus]|nr:hypothetical protein G6F31_017772 [Rhizopus arrhizus]